MTDVMKTMKWVITIESDWEGGLSEEGALKLCLKNGEQAAMKRL